MDFINYLETLKPDDWNKIVTDEWTVKDIVAHMVGWEKGDPDIIEKTWKTKRPPWWMTTDDYDEFNRKNVEFYKNHSPQELIAEWKKWQEHLQRKINRIGEEKLRERTDLFGWLFDEGDNSHYKHHLNQIKRALDRDKN